MANYIVLNCINTLLLTTYTQKKQWAQYSGIQYNNQKADILNIENVKKKRK